MAASATTLVPCCSHSSPARPPRWSTPPRQQHRRRSSRCARAAAAAQPPPPPPAQAEEVAYHDSPTDIAFIALCRLAYGRIAGWQSPRSWTSGEETFRGMVEVSRALMRGRSAAQQRAAVTAGFPAVPPWFRRLFPYSRWGAELNARITPAFFTWLVGPMETAEAELPGGQRQQSAVAIKRCRYLAESGCTAMCANLCKAPTQAFFTEQLGMPLSMEPNFEDLSCKVLFFSWPSGRAARRQFPGRRMLPCRLRPA